MTLDLEQPEQEESMENHEVVGAAQLLMELQQAAREREVCCCEFVLHRTNRVLTTSNSSETREYSTLRTLLGSRMLVGAMTR